MPRRIFPAVCRKPRTHSRNEDGSGAGQVLLPKPRTHSRMLLQRLPSWSDELFTPCVEATLQHHAAPAERALLVPPPSLVCSFRAKVALDSRQSLSRKPACAWLPASAAPTPGVHAVLAQFIHSPPRFSVILMQSSACMKRAVGASERLYGVSRRINGAGA
jgi:hypothetical protein